MPRTETLTLRELLDTSVAISAELRRRGYIRTGTSLAGELMERVTATAYAAHLEAPVNAGWDAVTPDGMRLQIKTRFLEPGARRAFAFKNLEFDTAILIWLDSSTFTITWAREISLGDLQPLLTPHATAGYRLSPTRAAVHGFDITTKLRDILDTLA